MRLSCQKTIAQGNGKTKGDWSVRPYTKEGEYRIKTPRAKTIRNAIISMNGDIIREAIVHKAKAYDLKNPIDGQATRMVGILGKIKVMRTSATYNTWTVYNPKLFG